MAIQQSTLGVITPAVITSLTTISATEMNTHRDSYGDRLNDLTQVCKDLENNYKSASVPADLENGKFWYDSTNQVVKYYKAGVWHSLESIPSSVDGAYADAWNGSIFESSTSAVTSDGVTVTLTLEKEDGGDLTINTNAGPIALDCVPALTVTLTPGTDEVPVLNYIYVLASNNTLTSSTASFPSADHARISTVLVQSAASVQTDGVMKDHKWTDHIKDGQNIGHVSHINTWIRSQPATWVSGVVQTTTVTTNGGSKDNIDFATTAGLALQLHDHIYPAFDTGASSSIYVVNDSAAPYTQVTDLGAITLDSSGNSLTGNNTYYSLVIWGCVSEATGDCKMFVNLPSDSYGSSNTAVSDRNGYDNFTIPADYLGCGFLIARITLRYRTSSSGTFDEIQTEDLRQSNVSGGSAGSGTTSFEYPDNLFRIQNATDPTKELDFALSGITTGTTRTWTVGDLDLTFDQSVANGASPTFGTMTATTVAGTLSTAAQANVTSLGTLTSLAITGDLTVDTNTLYVDSSNNRVGIGTDSPVAKLDIGFGASVTGNALTVKCDQFAHGVTTVLDTDVTFSIGAISGTEGGMYTRAITEGTRAYDLQSIATTEDTTTGTSSTATIEIHAKKANGTGVTTQGATANILAVRNSSVSRILVKGDGSTYWTDGTMAVDCANDRVGIGTSSPGAQFHNADGTTMFGSDTWPTTTIGKSGDRVYVGSDSDNVIMILQDAQTPVAADRQSQVILGALATSGGTDMGGAKLIGAKSNATSGNAEGYAAIMTSDSGGSFTEQMRIDSDGNVGIGTSSPDSPLHVYTGDSAGTANASADELVLESNGNAGLSIMSPAANNGYIMFGDDSNNAIGTIRYGHADDSMTFTASGNKSFRLDVTGAISTGGETAPDVDGGGICLNIGTGAEWLSVKGSNIAHGLSSTIETDSAVHYQTNSDGRTVMNYVSDNESVVFDNRIFARNTAGTGNTSAAIAIFNISQHDGADTASAVAAGGNMMSLQNNGTNTHNFKGNGDITNDGVVTAYDEEDDISLARTLALWSGGREDAPDWDRHLMGAMKPRLTKLGIMDDDGFISLNKSRALTLGAIGQQTNVLKGLLNTVKHLGSKLGMDSTEIDGLLMDRGADVSKIAMAY